MKSKYFSQKNWDLSSGIWGTDNFVLQTVQNDTADDQLTLIKTELSTQFNISIDEYDWTSGDMEVPINSAAVSRAKLFVAAASAGITNMPMTLEKQAEFWVSFVISAWSECFLKHIRRLYSSVVSHCHAKSGMRAAATLCTESDRNRTYSVFTAKALLKVLSEWQIQIPGE